MDKITESFISDKSNRSVFIGNIPYEVTESQLKEVFSEVGPVISLKLVIDRETGKPKGYGFCEYNDQETAFSAIRNLNGREIGGRNLRVDNACTEKSRMEMQQILQGPLVEQIYGDPVSPDEAPEVITKFVSSLSKERLLQFVTEMKACLEQNPAEARSMLERNPQISYALLQAQISLKLIDPKDASKFLHCPSKAPPLLDKHNVPSTSKVNTFGNMLNAEEPVALPSTSGVNLPMMDQHVDFPYFLTYRPTDPRIRQSRNPQSAIALPSTSTSPASQQLSMDGPDFNVDLSASTSFVNPLPAVSSLSLQDPVNIDKAIRFVSQLSPAASSSGTTNEEKVALIMQVLQLTDAQIAQLPLEQRDSIIQLKEQISRSS